MDRIELDDLLDELRRVRDDHQTVEAKRSRSGLPTSTWETLSAFANSTGGTLLFGVDEAKGRFEVTGVEDPGWITDAIRNVCAELEPPLRPEISTVHHPDGDVVVAVVAAIPHDRRPCHSRQAGPSAAYVRVGDGDHRLTRTEVDEMLAARSGEDFSRRPAQAGAQLDPAAVRTFLARFRSRSPREADVPDEMLLQRTGVIDDRGQPTLAGTLLLGDHPQSLEAAANVAVRREPGTGSPTGTRMRGRHYAGTLGELIDDLMIAITAELHTFQVQQGGRLVDEFDAPAEAIRELLSNALMHRSFSPAMATAQVTVSISDHAVEIISPGGIHTGTDPTTLGLEPIAGLRNLTLVNVAELLTTPSGARLVEHQASGIKAADRACHRAGTMPTLFVDHPTRFSAVLLRGKLDGSAAVRALDAKGLSVTSEAVRLLSVAHRLDTLATEAHGHDIGMIRLDARLAARVLSPCHVEDAATQLRRLEDGGVLERRTTRRDPAWVPVARYAADEPRGRSDSRIPDMLAAIANSPTGELRPKEIAERLGVSSPTARNRWLRRGVELGLIEPTKDSAFDPAQSYRLTAAGRARVAATTA